MTPTRIFIATIVGTIIFASGCGSCGREASAQRAPAMAASDGAGETRLLATIPPEARPPSSAPSGFGMHAPTAPGQLEFTFGERGGVAWVAGVGEDVQVFHDGRPGKVYSAVGPIALSPDGRRCAYGALSGGKWRMVVDGAEGRSFDTVRSPIFSPDGAHLAYQAMAGERWHLVVDGTVDAGTRTRYLKHAFSADSSRIAFVTDVDDRERGSLVVSDLGFEHPVTLARGVSAMHVAPASAKIAVVMDLGERRRLQVLDMDRPQAVDAGGEYDAISDVVVCPEGTDVVWVGERDGKRFVAAKDREAPVTVGDLAGPPVCRSGSRTVGALMASEGAVVLREFFAEQGPREGIYEEAEGLVYSDDGRSHAYAARRGERWFLVVNGKEGQPLDRVVTPRFTRDGARVVYRARQDGQRFVVVAGLDGKTVRQGSAYEQVFPVSVAPDGRSIAYGVKDGRALAWKTEAP
ncbi:MAG: hypothetical protein WCC48_02155 [Anaeromyxobacteraceae bacterium]